MIVGFFPATTMPDADWWQVLWPHPEEALVEMGVRPGMVAGDLCCGDGLFTAPLACIADRVYAIDIDPCHAGSRSAAGCRGGGHHRLFRPGARHDGRCC